MRVFRITFRAEGLYEDRAEAVEAGLAFKEEADRVLRDGGFHGRTSVRVARARPPGRPGRRR